MNIHSFITRRFGVAPAWQRQRVMRNAFFLLLAFPLMWLAFSCERTATLEGLSTEGSATTAGARVPIGRLLGIAEGDSERAGELYLFTATDDPRQISDVSGMPGKPTHARVTRRRLDGSWETFMVPTVSYPEISDVAISPDGRYVVYSLGDPSRQERGLWLLQIGGGTRPVQLTSRAWDRYPCWKPDGTMIAFVRTTWREGMQSSTDDLFMVSVNAPHTAEVLAKLSHHDGILCPTWSPDGKTLLFERRQIVPPKGLVRRCIWRLDVATGEISQLTLGGVSAARPAWFPDGKTFAYSARKGGAWNIYACDADGSNQRVLVDTRRDETDPTVSPDGRYVAFLRRSGKYRKFRRIYIVDLETGNIMLLTPSPIIGWERPSWGPEPKGERDNDREYPSGT